MKATATRSEHSLLRNCQRVSCHVQRIGQHRRLVTFSLLRLAQPHIPSPSRQHHRHELVGRRVLKLHNLMPVPCQLPPGAWHLGISNFDIHMRRIPCGYVGQSRLRCGLDAVQPPSNVPAVLRDRSNRRLPEGEKQVLHHEPPNLPLFQFLTLFSACIALPQDPTRVRKQHYVASGINSASVVSNCWKPLPFGTKAVTSPKVLSEMSDRPENRTIGS